MTLNKRRLPSRLWIAAVALGTGVALTGTGLAAASGIESAAGPAEGEATFVPVEPCRLMDTRPSGVGDRSVPLGPGESHVQQVTGAVGECSIPTGAVAVSANVTVVGPTASGYLTLYPADAPRPLASNLNWTAGQAPTPNKVDVQLSQEGSVAIFNFAGTVDVVMDVNGYYTEQGIVGINGRLDELQGQRGDSMTGPRSFTVTERVRITPNPEQPEATMIWLDVPPGFWWMDFSITPDGDVITPQTCRIKTAERDFILSAEGETWFMVPSSDPGIYVTCEFGGTDGGAFEADLSITVRDKFGTYEIVGEAEAIPAA